MTAKTPNLAGLALGLVRDALAVRDAVDQSPRHARAALVDLRHDVDDLTAQLDRTIAKENPRARP